MQLRTIFEFNDEEYQYDSDESDDGSTLCEEKHSGVYYIIGSYDYIYINSKFVKKRKNIDYSRTVYNDIVYPHEITELFIADSRVYVHELLTIQFENLKKIYMYGTLYDDIIYFLARHNFIKDLTIHMDSNYNMVKLKNSRPRNDNFVGINFIETINIMQLDRLTMSNCNFDKNINKLTRFIPNVCLFDTNLPQDMKKLFYRYKFTIPGYSLANNVNLLAYAFAHEESQIHILTSMKKYQIYGELTGNFDFPILG